VALRPDFSGNLLPQEGKELTPWIFSQHRTFLGLTQCNVTFSKIRGVVLLPRLSFFRESLAGVKSLFWLEDIRWKYLSPISGSPCRAAAMGVVLPKTSKVSPPTILEKKRNPPVPGSNQFCHLGVTLPRPLNQDFSFFWSRFPFSFYSFRIIFSLNYVRYHGVFELFLGFSI